MKILFGDQNLSYKEKFHPQILVPHRSAAARALGPRQAHPERGHAAEHAVLAVVDDAFASADPG